MEQILFPNKKYNVIYADPPWHYRTSRRRGYSGVTSLKYETMSLNEIKTLPIINITTKDAYLFLWCPCSWIQEAIEVCNAWGFIFKTEIIWAKISKNGTIYPGMGYHIRLAHENLLIGIKGKPKPRVHNIPSVILAPKLQRHSEKPHIFRDYIEQLTYRPRLELFARKKTGGWDVWGDEV